MTDDPLAALAALTGVPAAVDEARAAIDRLHGHRVMRRRSAIVVAESALRGARASAALEGSDVPLDALRALVRDGADPAPGPDPAVLRGAVRVGAEVGSLVPTWRRAPLQALARLHVLAAGDPGSATDPAVLGRPRPDASAEVTVRLDALARVATTSRVPAAVVAAVVHGEILALAPFGTANGIVARAAQRLVLLDRGLDATGASVPEVGHLDAGDGAYATAAEGYAHGGLDGVGGWVRHVAAALALGAREGLAVCEAVQRGAASAPRG